MLPHIDPLLYKALFVGFRSFVENKSGMRFHSFQGNTYTQEEEGYKDELYGVARRTLQLTTWKLEDVGTGRIAKRLVQAIEIPGNNLVPFKPKYGEADLPHKLIRDARTDKTKAKGVESCIYDIYKSDQDEKSFSKAVEVFGKKYSLLAYLFFLKDKSRYLPIATKSFDFIFPALGAEFKTSAQCSWDNYTTFIGLISELKLMLIDSLGN